MAGTTHRHKTVWLTALCAILVATPLTAFAVEIEQVARTGDPVPGREDMVNVIFRGRATQPNSGIAGGVFSKPSINEGGALVFRATSSDWYDFNRDTARGIYCKQPNFSLTVLVDTTLDDNNMPTYPVPGRGPEAYFTEFLPPIINDNGDVLFWASSSSPVDGARTGFYATNIDGQMITKIVDSADEVPGYPGQTFNRGFRFSGTWQDRLLACMNDAGQVAFYGNFLLDGEPYEDQGLYGGTVDGATPILLADTTGTIFPADDDKAFTHLDDGSLPAINNNGLVIFEGGVGAPNVFDGVYVAPANGSALPATLAREYTYAPTTSDNDEWMFYGIFGGHDINDNDQIVIQHEFINGYSRFDALFGGTVSAGLTTTIADQMGGFTVPSREDGTFQNIATATINGEGALGFASWDTSSVANGQGIYAANITDDSIALVANNTMLPPEREAPASFSSFDNTSGAINDNGLIFITPNATDGVSRAIYGLWYYSPTTGALERIVDDTTSIAPPPNGLDGDFFELSGSQIRFVSIYGGFEGRAGHYNSVNGSDEVAFTAAFSTFDVGVYVARLGGGEGSLQVNLYVEVGEEDGLDAGDILISPDENVEVTINGIEGTFRTGDYTPPIEGPTTVLVRRYAGGVSKAQWFTIPEGATQLNVNFAQLEMNLYSEGGGDPNVYDDPADFRIPNDAEYTHVHAGIDNLAEDLRTGSTVFAPPNTSILLRQHSYGISKAFWYNTGAGTAHRLDVNYAQWIVRLMNDANGDFEYEEIAGDVIIDNSLDHVRITIDRVTDELSNPIVMRTGDRVILPRLTSVLVRQYSYGLSKSIWHSSGVDTHHHAVNFAAWNVRLIADSDGNSAYDEGTDDVLINSEADYVRMTIDNVTDEFGERIVWRSGDRVILPRQTSALVRQYSYGLSKAVWHSTGLGITDHDVNFAAWNLSLVVPDFAGDLILTDDVANAPYRITLDNVTNEFGEHIEWRTGDMIILPRQTSVLVRKKAYDLSKAVWMSSNVGFYDDPACYARIDFTCGGDGCTEVATINGITNELDEPIEYGIGESIIVPPNKSLLIHVNDGEDYWAQYIGGFDCGITEFPW